MHLKAGGKPGRGFEELLATRFREHLLQNRSTLGVSKQGLPVPRVGPQGHRRIWRQCEKPPAAFADAVASLAPRVGPRISARRGAGGNGFACLCHDCIRGAHAKPA
eukprot:477751-Lingulodinium_polyedra.AAC.1